MVAGAVLVAVLSLAAASLIQHFYAHPRPFVDREDVILLLNHGADASLPSEHAVVAFSLAGAALWSRRLLLASSLLVAAAALGVARVYTGLHYAADIGAAAGVGPPGELPRRRPRWTHHHPSEGRCGRRSTPGGPGGPAS
jgi:membrane-associated phospholipid phosphatase